MLTNGEFRKVAKKSKESSEYKVAHKKRCSELICCEYRYKEKNIILFLYNNKSISCHIKTWLYTLFFNYPSNRLLFYPNQVEGYLKYELQSFTVTGSLDFFIYQICHCHILQTLDTCNYLQQCNNLLHLLHAPKL